MTSDTTAKKFLLAGAVLLAATSASLAQGYQRQYFGYGPDVGYGGYYDYAPGYGPSFGYYDYDRGPYHMRGGPGPRVGNGTGMGAGAER
ncbi:MAG: hypothetical protein ABSE22_21395 [Xanthobacteraceae bacterium]|jgi:hypothetical protein